MTTRYRGLTLKQIVEQLNLDQFARLCEAVDEKNGKGTRFDILSVKPFRNSKDESMIAVSVMLSSSVVKLIDLPEKV